MSVVIVEAVAILLLAAAVLYLMQAVRSKDHALRAMQKTTELAWKAMKETSDQLVHHLTTARKEGYTFQPVDEQWETYRNTDVLPEPEGVA